MTHDEVLKLKPGDLVVDTYGFFYSDTVKQYWLRINYTKLQIMVILDIKNDSNLILCSDSDGLLEINCSRLQSYDMILEELGKLNLI